MHILIPIGFAVLAFVLGFYLHKMLVTKEIGGASAEADRILSESRREVESLKKEALLEGREKIVEERAVELERLRRKQSELDKRHKKIPSSVKRKDSVQHGSVRSNAFRKMTKT